MTVQAHAGVPDEIYALVRPFDRRGVELTPATSFREDLALDSLAVMELVAAIEDHFDIVLPLNLLPDIHTVGDLAARVAGILESGRGHGHA